jgi:acetyl esterase/lipase
VFLHHLLWEQDADGLLQRMDEFLKIADRHRIGVMFVLFDSCWDPNPQLGPQHDPRPGVHNSGWVQSPGSRDLAEASRHALLEAYVKGVVGRFKDDPRVKVWDIWNEPDNTNDKSYGPANLKQELPDKKQRTLELLPRAFAWAREANPSQPLTSGLWLGDHKANPSRLLPIEKAQLDGSDVISFHCYDNPDGMEKWLQNLRPLNRPLICTEYMARPIGSRFDPILGYLKQEKIGAFNWGFVAGKTNTIYAWDSWQKHYEREPEVWFHDIFRPDGRPFDAKEVEYIRSVTGAGTKSSDASPAAHPTTTAAYARREVIYGRKDGTALTMDVITPTAAARNGAGVIIVVSGGWFSWHDAISPQFIDTFGGELMRRGYTLFAVVHGTQPRYTIPEITGDIGRAVRFIRAHAADYGIDAERLGICGGSAGGHLSLMQGLAPAAAHPEAPDPVERQSARVAAVAAFFPPTDFFNYGKPGENALGRGVLAPFKGAFDFKEMDPKTHAWRTITDEQRILEIGHAISPVDHVSSDDPPTLLIHGDADTLVPIQQSQELLEKLEAAKVPCKLVTKPAAGHGWANLQNDMKAVADWFDQYLVHDPTTAPSH